MSLERHQAWERAMERPLPLCRECDGTGEMEVPDPTDTEEYVIVACDACDGTGVHRRET